MRSSPYFLNETGPPETFSTLLLQPTRRPPGRSASWQVRQKRSSCRGSSCVVEQVRRDHQIRGSGEPEIRRIRAYVPTAVRMPPFLSLGELDHRRGNIDSCDLTGPGLPEQPRVEAFPAGQVPARPFPLCRPPIRTACSVLRVRETKAAWTPRTLSRLCRILPLGLPRRTRQRPGHHRTTPDASSDGPDLTFHGVGSHAQSDSPPRYRIGHHRQPYTRPCQWPQVTGNVQRFCYAVSPLTFAFGRGAHAIGSGEACVRSPAMSFVLVIDQHGCAGHDRGSYFSAFVSDINGALGQLAYA